MFIYVVTQVVFCNFKSFCDDVCKLCDYAVFFYTDINWNNDVLY